MITRISRAFTRKTAVKHVITDAGKLVHSKIKVCGTHWVYVFGIAKHVYVYTV